MQIRTLSSIVAISMALCGLGAFSAVASAAQVASLPSVATSAKTHGTIAIPAAKPKPKRVVAHAAACNYEPSGYFRVPAYPVPAGAQTQQMFCSTNYTHVGNAESFIAYTLNWCVGYGCNTETFARTQLSGQGINMFAVPTSTYSRESNTSVWSEIYWIRPDNRTYCWFYGRTGGSDNAPVGTSGLNWACGPY